MCAWLCAVHACIPVAGLLVVTVLCMGGICATGQHDVTCKAEDASRNLHASYASRHCSWTTFTKVEGYTAPHLLHEHMQLLQRRRAASAEHPPLTCHVQPPAPLCSASRLFACPEHACPPAHAWSTSCSLLVQLALLMTVCCLTPMVRHLAS